MILCDLTLFHGHSELAKRRGPHSLHWGEPMEIASFLPEQLREQGYWKSTSETRISHERMYFAHGTLPLLSMTVR
jgi:hypothetical protein